MEWRILTGALALVMAAGPAGAVVPLYDPVSLNIGINCQWQKRCIADQSRAMKKAREYVAKSAPPLWRIHLCNRNAGRGPQRVDWVGFSNCIRNAALRPPPPPPPLSRHRRKRH